MAERDKLGAQLLKRNKEAAALYDQAAALTTALHQAQAAHRQRLADIRVLNIKVCCDSRNVHLLCCAQRVKKAVLRWEKGPVIVQHVAQVLDLQREQHRLQGGLANVEVLKREVHHLGCELLAEKSRARAMADELETPLNVHRCEDTMDSNARFATAPSRWRMLEASDPPLFDMVVKVQTLQRRLLAKTEELAAKEAQLAQREQHYAELKGVLARHPGPEAVEQLAAYRVRRCGKQTRTLL